jgi:general stress protein 26
MNTLPQTRADLAHVAHLIGDIQVAMLTNVEADGDLASRPMVPLEMDADGALWFFTDLRSAKVEHLRVVNLSFSDIAGGTYLSLSGRGEIDTDPGRIQRLWTPLARAWFPDGPESSALGLLKFVPDVADYWDAPQGRMQRAFGAVAAALTGRPADPGEHGAHAGLSTPEPAAAA